MNERFLDKLVKSVFGDSEQAISFRAAFFAKPAGEKALIWVKPRPTHGITWESLPPWPHQPEFVERVPESAAAGKNPLHEQGYYYCLDYSSVFAALPLAEIPHNSDLCVVDVCASPGGKSVLAQMLLKPRQLIANEVIGKRLGALTSNFRRLGFSNTRVMQKDTSQLGPLLSGAADVVLVDAPCSGQSLPLKGISSPGSLNPIQIQHNSKRQRRILANSSVIVKPGGHLLYMTCTFSPEENEEVVDWFLRKFPNFQAIPVRQLGAFQSPLTRTACYRLFPQQGMGAGSFTALLKNATES